MELDTYHNSVVILRLALHFYIYMPTIVSYYSYTISTTIGYLVYNSTHL